MKEAAGEANMTVITIILIGIVLAVGSVIIGQVMQKVGNKANDELDNTGSAEAEEAAAGAIGGLH